MLVVVIGIGQLEQEEGNNHLILLLEIDAHSHQVFNKKIHSN